MLKPCPFCGSSEIKVEHRDTVNAMTHCVVSCKCGAEMNGMIGEPEQKVIDFWNQRKED